MESEAEGRAQSWPWDISHVLQGRFNAQFIFPFPISYSLHPLSLYSFPLFYSPHTPPSPLAASPTPQLVPLKCRRVVFFRFIGSAWERVVLVPRLASR